MLKPKRYVESFENFSFKKEKTKICEVQFEDVKKTDDLVIASKFNNYFIRSINEISNFKEFRHELQYLYLNK